MSPASQVAMDHENANKRRKYHTGIGDIQGDSACDTLLYSARKALGSPPEKKQRANSGSRSSQSNSNRKPAEGGCTSRFYRNEMSTMTMERNQLIQKYLFLLLVEFWALNIDPTVVDSVNYFWYGRDKTRIVLQYRLQCLSIEFHSSYNLIWWGLNFKHFYKPTFQFAVDTLTIP
jgi:hypothetical protein